VNEGAKQALGGAALLGVAAVWLAARGAFMSPKISIPTFDVPVDPYPPNEPVATYTPAPKPGVVAFRDWVLHQLGGTDLGISRSLADGQLPTSKHHEGRAWDWGPPSDAAADVLLDALLKTIDGDEHALARRAGIRVIIWQRRIWTAGTRSWQPYTKANPHTDHIHFGFSWDGALAKTSMYEISTNGQATVAQLEGLPVAATSGNGSQVDPIRTPLTDQQLAEVLAAAHVQVTSKPPSRARLGIAWAQVQHETARTHSAYNYNWGNIIATPAWTGDWHQLSGGLGPTGDQPGKFRAYPSAVAGAADYWRLLIRRYPRALEAFDHGDPNAAAAELRAAGYYEGDRSIYAAAMRRFYQEYSDKFNRQGWADKLAPLIAIGLCAAAAAAVEEYL
jgi:hypothetical protein